MMNNDARLALTTGEAALAALYLARALGVGDAAQLADYVATNRALDVSTRQRLDFITSIMAETVDAADGFDSALELIAEAVSAPHAATVYALTADYIAAFGTASAEQMHYLERLGNGLGLNRLTRAALDTAAQARSVALGGIQNDRA